jgi:hypothetical protein
MHVSARFCLISTGDRFDLASNIKAAAPATIGAALDVPLATNQPSLPAVSSPFGKTELLNELSKMAFFIVGWTMNMPFGDIPTIPQKSGQCLSGK